MKRHVALVIVPIDDFTNQVITENYLEFSIPYEKAPVWKPGFYVFSDIKQKEIIISIKSKLYQSQECSLTLEPANTIIMKVRMVPGEKYAYSKEGISVQGRGETGKVVRIYSTQFRKSYKLSADYIQNKRVSIAHPAEIDFTGKILGMKTREEEWFIQLGTLSEEENQYEITFLSQQEPNRTLRKMEVNLYPVYETKCREDGTFYLLLPKGEGEKLHAKLNYEGKEREIVLDTTKQNTINLVE